MEEYNQTFWMPTLMFVRTAISETVLRKHIELGPQAFQILGIVVNHAFPNLKLEVPQNQPYVECQEPSTSALDQIKIFHFARSL